MAFIKLFFALIFLNPNPIYIGVVEITSDKNSRQFELKVKVYTTHLEEAMLLETGRQVSVTNIKNLSASMTHINKYVLDHLEVSVNNQPLDLSFVRIENIGELTYLYYKGSRQGKIESVCVSSDMMFSISPKQNNIVRLFIDGHERFIRLASEKHNGEITF